MKKKLTYIIIFFSIALIIIGFIDKEYINMYNKAINICLECIGLG